MEVARSYTKQCFKTIDQFKADHFNIEADGISQQFNGQLDQNNMPLNSVEHDNMVVPVRTYNAHGVQTTSTYMPTQSYHFATFNIANDTNVVAGEMVTPVSVYNKDWDVDDWDPFWNSFQPDMPQGDRIRFNAKEGMLIGGVTINMENRSGRVRGGSDPGFTRNAGEENFAEIGIFCNGFLIGRSGRMNNGAHCLDIPYSTPIGNEFVEIQVKWFKEQYNIIDASGGTWTTVEVDHFRKIVISGVHTWCRNQYR